MTRPTADELAAIVRRDASGRRLCSLCDNRHYGHGMCRTCYRQWKRTGNPVPTVQTCVVDRCDCGGKVHDTTTAATTRRRNGIPGWVDLDRLAGYSPADRWRDRAACVGLEVDRFFPVSGHPAADVLATCAGCPVRYDCLAAELAHTRDYRDMGVWGGTSAVERNVIRDRLAARAS